MTIKALMKILNTVHSKYFSKTERLGNLLYPYNTVAPYTFVNHLSVDDPRTIFSKIIIDVIKQELVKIDKGLPDIIRLLELKEHEYITQIKPKINEICSKQSSNLSHNC